MPRAGHEEPGAARRGSPGLRAHPGRSRRWGSIVLRFRARARTKPTAPSSSPQELMRSMSVREIRLFGDPVLVSRADEVTAFDAKLAHLADDMLETMD